VTSLEERTDTATEREKWWLGRLNWPQHTFGGSEGLEPRFVPRHLDENDGFPHMPPVTQSAGDFGYFSTAAPLFSMSSTIIDDRER